MQLHIAGAFEFLKNNIIHTAAGFDQCRGNDGQTTMIFDIAGRSEKAFGFVQCRRIDTTGQDFTTVRLKCVVSPCQAGDAVKQDNHIFAIFDHAFGFFNNHFCDLGVTFRRFIKG